MTAHVQLKVGCVRCTRSLDASQGPGVVACGRQYPANSFYCVQIGIGEGVVALDRRVPRTCFIQRSERSKRLDVTDWLGIYEFCLEPHGLARADISHPKIADIELQRRFAWLIRIDKQFRIRARESVHDDAGFSSRPVKLTHLFPVFFWRDVHDQSAQIYRVDVHGFTKQASNGDLKAKLADFEERLNPGFPRIRIRQSINLQSFAVDMNAVGDPDVNLA